MRIAGCWLYYCLLFVFILYLCLTLLLHFHSLSKRPHLLSAQSRRACSLSLERRPLLCLHPACSATIRGHSRAPPPRPRTNSNHRCAIPRSSNKKDSCYDHYEESAKVESGNEKYNYLYHTRGPSMLEYTSGAIKLSSGMWVCKSKN